MGRRATCKWELTSTSDDSKCHQAGVGQLLIGAGGPCLTNFADTSADAQALLGADWGRKRELVDRRGFLRAAVAAAIAAQAKNLVADTVALPGIGRNLVPERPGSAPNYWCTWAAQNYMYGHDLSELDPKLLEGASGNKLAHQAISGKVLFGDGGWVNEFFRRVRSDLFFLLDDGWETGGTSTFELDTAKFRAFTGASASRLRKLNGAVQDSGWRGAGLWCRNTPGETRIIVWKA